MHSPMTTKHGENGDPARKAIFARMTPLALSRPFCNRGIAHWELIYRYETITIDVTLNNINAFLRRPTEITEMLGTE